MSIELTPATRQHVANAHHSLAAALTCPADPSAGGVPDLHLRQAQLVLTDLVPAERMPAAQQPVAASRTGYVSHAFAQLDLIPAPDLVDDVVMAKNFLAGLLAHYGDRPLDVASATGHR
jgi:hypothetical protein